jgi:hypothetical protein
MREGGMLWWMVYASRGKYFKTCANKKGWKGERERERESLAQLAAKVTV